MEKEFTVKIPISRLEELLDIETRTLLLMEYTQEQRYCVEREKVAHYLNFKLRQNPEPEKPIRL